MGVYDETRKMFLDDKSLAVLAKRQCDGEELEISKSDWLIAIEARAEELYKNQPWSIEQKFSRAIGGNARQEGHKIVDLGDPLAKLYYAAMKVAPHALDEKPAPQADIQAAVAKRSGTASEEMLRLARTHRAANPKLSEAQAYTAIRVDPKNIDLKNRADSEARGLWGGDETMQGDTEYQERMNRPYRNPHPGGSGPRPSAG